MFKDLFKELVIFGSIKHMGADVAEVDEDDPETQEENPDDKESDAAEEEEVEEDQDPAPEDKEDPPAVKSLDDSLKDATEKYQREMEKLGGKFNANGEFIGWETGGNQQVTTTNQDEYDDANDVERVKNEILEELLPTRINAAVDQAIANKPEFARYRDVVVATIKAQPGVPVTEQSVESLFVWARGQGADVEIAEALKSAGKENKKIDAGGAATSDGGTPVKKGTKNAKVDELTAKLAKGWGIDPQELANRRAAEFGDKKGKK